MKYKNLMKILLLVGILALAMSLVSAEKALLEEGKYQVGKDLPAGEYYVKCNSYNLYLAVSSDSSGDLDSVIYNLNTHGGTYITVKDGEYLDIQGGELYELKNAPDTGADGGKYKESMYKVGEDIPAGEYTVKSTEDQGYIEVASSSRHQVEDIVANDNFKTDKKVKLSDGQYLTLTNGAEIDEDDSSSGSSSSSSSSSDAEKVTIDGIDFNLPKGFKEDKSSYGDFDKDMEQNGVKFTVSGKMYKKDKDIVVLGVTKYDGYDATDDTAEHVGGKSMTVNGVEGYEYDSDEGDGFIYAKDGKLVSIIASSEDLIDQIVVK